MFILAEREAGLGHYKEALKILDSYRETFSKMGKETEYLRFKYRILKSLYFSEKSEKEREKTAGEIERTLKELLSNGNLKDWEFVYREAISMDMPELALESAEKLALETGKKQWYERALKLSTALKKWDEALKIVNLMAEEKPEFLKEGLIISQAAGERGNFEKFARKLIESGKFTTEELKSIVYFELSQKNYRGAEEFCREALKKKNDRETVKFCLNVALWTKDYSQVKRIVEENLNRFKGDREMLEAFLKVARMVNDPQLQLKVANSIFRLINGESR